MSKTLNKTRVKKTSYPQSLDLNSHQKDVERQLLALDKVNAVERLWSKDATLWKTEPEHQKIIRNSLGWLNVADGMAERMGELRDFAEEVKADGITDLVLLGMGGSSLAPELFRASLPAKKGYPRLHVLDSTDPEWVLSVEQAVNLKKTLFIVSSKSGTTIEPASFFSYFFARVKENGSQFVAITDPGTYLEKMAKEKGFRKTFINPADIGGRFSALSYFGLVPASLAGMDAEGLVDRARKMMVACGPEVSADQNPAAELGVAIGELAKKGVDKLTLILPEWLEPFGLWVEQLVAESSGKEGKGIVPIAGESLSEPGRYSSDRLFVAIGTEKEKALHSKAQGLAERHPFIHIPVAEPVDMGAELIRWEIATAIACSLLGVNAFDQPDVQAAKDQTNTLLNEIVRKGTLPSLSVDFKKQKFHASFSKEIFKSFSRPGWDPNQDFKSFIDVKKGDYIGNLAYSPSAPGIDHKLQQLRGRLRETTNAATLFGYGPRYLHSTGQLHKGGPNTGIFLLITVGHKKDLKIPGQAYTFGQLETAQAIGDFQALDSKKRRAVRFHVERPNADSLEEVLKFAVSLFSRKS